MNSVKVKKEKKKKLDFSLEITKLTYAYTFLLCASVVFVISLDSFKFKIFDTNNSYAIFVLPFLYFIVDLILKEIGYKPARKSVIISSVVVFITSIIVDMAFGLDFNILKHVGVLVAYFISQFLNMSIYYYMLDNYKTPYFFVVVNLIFCLLVNNMLCMLLSQSLVFTESFWPSYLIVIVIQLLVSMILAILLNLVEQGLDVEE